MHSNILKMVSRIFFYGMTILEVVNLFLNPFSNHAFWYFSWGQVISGAFIIAVVAVVMQQDFEYRSLKRAKPSVEYVKVLPPEKDRYYLEVKNKGSFGSFSAQIKVLEDNNNHLTGSTLVGYWEKGKNHDESEIKHDHIDRIELVHLIYQNGDLAGIDLVQCIIPENNRRQPLQLRWTQSPKNPNYKNIAGRLSVIVLPQIYKLRVAISSKPDLEEGSFTKDFLWNSDTGLTEL